MSGGAQRKTTSVDWPRSGLGHQQHTPNATRVDSTPTPLIGISHTLDDENPLCTAILGDGRASEFPSLVSIDYEKNVFRLFRARLYTLVSYRIGSIRLRTAHVPALVPVPAETFPCEFTDFWREHGRQLDAARTRVDPAARLPPAEGSDSFLGGTRRSLGGRVDVEEAVQKRAAGGDHAQDAVPRVHGRAGGR